MQPLTAAGVADGPTADPADPQLDPWRAFLQAHAHVTRLLERELQLAHGMTLAEYDVLAQLAQRDHLGILRRRASAVG